VHDRAQDRVDTLTGENTGLRDAALAREQRHEADLAGLHAEHRDETTRLHGQIDALRTELDQQRREHDATLTAARADAAREQRDRLAEQCTMLTEANQHQLDTLTQANAQLLDRARRAETQLDNRDAPPPTPPGIAGGGQQG
jgi:colicin import membrane protein